MSIAIKRTMCVFFATAILLFNVMFPFFKSSAIVGILPTAIGTLISELVMGIATGAAEKDVQSIINFYTKDVSYDLEGSTVQELAKNYVQTKRMELDNGSHPYELLSLLGVNENEYYDILDAIDEGVSTYIGDDKFFIVKPDGSFDITSSNLNSLVNKCRVGLFDDRYYIDETTGKGYLLSDVTYSGVPDYVTGTFFETEYSCDFNSPLIPFAFLYGYKNNKIYVSACNVFFNSSYGNTGISQTTFLASSPKDFSGYKLEDFPPGSYPKQISGMNKTTVNNGLLNVQVSASFDNNKHYIFNKTFDFSNSIYNNSGVYFPFFNVQNSSDYTFNSSDFEKMGFIIMPQTGLNHKTIDGKTVIFPDYPYKYGSEIERNGEGSIPLPVPRIPGIIGRGQDVGVIPNDNPVINIGDDTKIDNVPVDKIIEKIIEKETIIEKDPPKDKPETDFETRDVIIDKFPFSIPFDLYRILTLFVRPEKKPIFEFPIKTEMEVAGVPIVVDEKFIVDLSYFSIDGVDIVQVVLRFGCYIGFVVMLIKITPKLFV